MPDFKEEKNPLRDFLSSALQVLAEMCQSGYKDALRFLEENREYMLAQPATFTFTDGVFAADRPADAGTSERRPRAARERARVLQTHREHQRVAAAEAPPAGETALVDG